MTVYYMTDPLYDSQPKSKVSAFKPVSLGSPTEGYLQAGVQLDKRDVRFANNCDRVSECL